MIMIEGISKYLELVADLEKEVGRVSELYRNSLKCCPGCSECCCAFSVFPIEAEIIRLALQGILENENAAVNGSGRSLNRVTIAESTDELGGKDDSSCFLLKDQRCSIYEHRPLICRTQGLPIGYVDHEKGVIEVSACELNFSGTDFDVNQLFMMDAFNTRLQEINAEFCQKRNIDPWQRVSIGDILSGA